MKKSIKRIFALVAALILCLLAVSCGGGNGEVPSGWKEASTDKCDFNFYVPENWTVESSTAAVSVYYSSDDPSNVSVMGWQIDSDVTSVDDWWAINEADVSLVFADLEVVNTENTMIDGIFAKSFTYTAFLGENKYKIMQTAVIKNGNVYVLTYTSTEELFDDHTNDVSSMIGYMTID